MSKGSALLVSIGAGSNPAYSTNIGIYISWLDSDPDKIEVGGSNPSMPTK